MNATATATKETVKQKPGTSEVSTSVRAQAPRFTNEQIAAASLHSDADLPALAEAKVAPVPLSVEYWSPEVEGETKRCWILGIEDREIADMETGELKEIESVLFVEQTDTGQIKRWFCACKILVANIADAIERGEIIPASRLTPVQIKYTGMVKNSRNAFKSKRFEILPIVWVQ
jgi:hypothetical protein